MMMIFGFYQLGNDQMYFNEVMEMEYKDEPIIKRYYIHDYSRGVDATIFILIFLFIILFQTKIFAILQRLSLCVRRKQ